MAFERSSRTAAIRRLGRLACIIGLASLGLPSGGCNEPASPRAGPARVQQEEPCQAEPLEAFDASEIGSTGGSASFTARVTGIEAPDEFGRVAVALEEKSGTPHRLSLRLGAATNPLLAGSEYDFALERVGGTPPASALVVRDASGLVLAGATDQGIGAHVLAGGVPGFALELLASTCASRPHDACVEAAFNLPLRVSHGGASATIYQGSDAVLEGYQVRCLVAQRVQYSSRCADYALPGVSWIITGPTPIK